MRSLKARRVAFSLHRYIGLVVGLILVIVGLTGSVLVFEPELDRVLLTQKYGQVTPQPEMASYDAIAANIKAAYKNDPNTKDLKISYIDLRDKPDVPAIVYVEGPSKERSIQVAVNQYTGQILGSRIWEDTFYGIVYRLHYALLAGDTGMVIVGIVAALLLILTVTGILLWSGWRKLISGFKIKWNAHPKRTNYDIHKVAGIISAIFLAMIAFTGFCWNFYTQTEPIIYALTLTPKPAEPVSKPIPGKTPLSIDDIVQRSTIAFPDGKTVFIGLPSDPTSAYRVGKRLPQDRNAWGSSEVYLDQFSGAVVKIKDGRSLSRADQVYEAFVPMHYGTFGGIYTRILYIFVGLSPTLLLITGGIMWWYRKRRHQPVIVSALKSITLNR